MNDYIFENIFDKDFYLMALKRNLQRFKCVFIFQTFEILGRFLALFNETVNKVYFFIILIYKTKRAVLVRTAPLYVCVV